MLHSGPVDEVVRIFRSFEDAHAADCEQDRNMTPQERIATVLELRAWAFPDETVQRTGASLSSY